MFTLRSPKVNTLRSLKGNTLRGLTVFTLRSPKVNTLRSLKGTTLRIKLYRTILYNFNCKIYIRDFAQHLRKIRKKYDRR